MRHLSALALLLALPAAAAAETLTFEEARRAVLAANPQALAAQRDLEAAELRVRAARAGFFPSFNASASYARSGTQGFDPGDAYSYGFSGSQPLFAPGVPASVRSAAAARRSAQAAADRAASRLTFELKTAFADLLNAAGAVKLSGETLARRAENLELIRLKYEAGRENKAALLETEAALKTAQWQHERYLKNLLLAGRRLNRLLGRAPRAPAPDVVPPAVPEPPADFSVFEPRLREHYAVRAARAARDSAQAAADAAGGARLPEASATGSYKWNGSDWPEKRSGWSLGASVSVPLFAGGRLSSSLGAARAALGSAEAALKDAGDEVALAAEDAFLAWREARALLDAAQSSLDAAQARAWLVRKQYLAGQASYFEWRGVEEQLISERNQRLAADRGLVTAHAAFLQSIGE